MELESDVNEWLHSLPTPQGYPDTPLLSEYLAWLMNVRNRSRETVRSYRSTLQAWIAFLGAAGKTIEAATLSDLETFQVRPRKRRGAGGSGAPVTQRREITAVRLFHRWAFARGHITHDAFVDAPSPTVRTHLPRPIPDGVWLKHWTQDMPNGLRTAIGLGYFCGLRRAEIVSLTVDQITDARIVNFTRKGGGEDVLPWRTLVRVYETHLPNLGHERFLEAIARSRRSPGDWLAPFREPTWMNRAMHKQGMPFTPHQLRHSAATNLVRAGTPLPLVSRMMNHSSVDITMLYVQAGGDELGAWLRGSGERQ